MQPSGSWQRLQLVTDSSQVAAGVKFHCSSTGAELCCVQIAAHCCCALLHVCAWCAWSQRRTSMGRGRQGSTSPGTTFTTLPAAGYGSGILRWPGGRRGGARSGAVAEQRGWRSAARCGVRCRRPASADPPLLTGPQGSEQHAHDRYDHRLAQVAAPGRGRRLFGHPRRHPGADRGSGSCNRSTGV